MKKIITAIAIAISLVACEHDDSTLAIHCTLATQSDATSSQPAFVYTYNGDKVTKVANANQYYNYSYDNNGNITKVEEFNTGSATPRGRVTYSYIGNQVQSTTIYELNSNVLVPESRIDYVYSGNLVAEKKLYDLSVIPTGVYDGKNVYTWSAQGNITQYKELDATNTVRTTFNFTYDLTRLNTFGNRFPNFPQIDISGNFGDEEETALFTSMNALATSQEVGQSQDTFTYTYNDNYLITSIKIGNNAPYYVFTYNCQ